jgi:hypothetical protein
VWTQEGGLGTQTQPFPPGFSLQVAVRTAARNPVAGSLPQEAGHAALRLRTQVSYRQLPDIWADGYPEPWNPEAMSTSGSLHWPQPLCVPAVSSL